MNTTKCKYIICGQYNNSGIVIFFNIDCYLHPKTFVKLSSNFFRSLNLVAPSASANNKALPLALSIPLNQLINS